MVRVSNKQDRESFRFVGITQVRSTSLPARHEILLFGRYSIRAVAACVCPLRTSLSATRLGSVGQRMKACSGKGLTCRRTSHIIHYVGLGVVFYLSRRVSQEKTAICRDVSEYNEIAGFQKGDAHEQSDMSELSGRGSPITVTIQFCEKRQSAFVGAKGKDFVT